MKKKILSLILAVAMIFTMMPTAFAGQTNFSDLAEILPGSETVTGLFLQVLNGGLLGKEDGLQEIKDLIDQQYNKKYQTAGYVADENSYYVSLGDSTITGIATGDPAYGNYGYKTKVPTSAPYQVAQALGVEYQQLAMAGLRTTDLRYVLDASFTPDEYAQKVTTDRINTYAGGLVQMRSDYLAELQKADLITVAIGNCNFSDFVKAQLFGSISNLLNDQLGTLLNGALGGTIKNTLTSYGIDLAATTYQMNWEGYLGAEGAQKLKAALEDAKAMMLEEGVPEVYSVNLAEMVGMTSLPSVIQKKMVLNIPMVELMVYYMECFLYGYVTFVVDFEAAFDKIHEIAPEAELLVLSMYNPADEMSFSFGEQIIPFGEYYGYIAKVMSMYFAEYAKNTEKTSFVDVYETQSKADNAGGTYELMEFVMSFSSKIDEFYATAEGHTYMKEQILAALAPKTEGVMGDADGSGEADYLDAMIVLQYHTGTVGDADLDLAVCDVDGSGEVDYLDAMMILQYHTGVISAF